MKYCVFLLTFAIFLFLLLLFFWRVVVPHDLSAHRRICTSPDKHQTLVFLPLMHLSLSSSSLFVWWVYFNCSSSLSSISHHSHQISIASRHSHYHHLVTHHPSPSTTTHSQSLPPFYVLATNDSSLTACHASSLNATYHHLHHQSLSTSYHCCVGTRVHHSVVVCSGSGVCDGSILRHGFVSVGEAALYCNCRWLWLRYIDAITAQFSCLVSPGHHHSSSTFIAHHQLIILRN